MAAIDKQFEVLASTATEQKRLTALKYVVHFVADIHQPLHAGYAEDRGGNQYQLQAFMRGSNLHALWDVGLIKHLDLTNEALPAKLLAKMGPGWLVQCGQHLRGVLPDRRYAGVLPRPESGCAVHRAVHAGDGGAASGCRGAVGCGAEPDVPLSVGQF